MSYLIKYILYLGYYFSLVWWRLRDNTAVAELFTLSMHAHISCHTNMIYELTDFQLFLISGCAFFLAFQKTFFGLLKIQSKSVCILYMTQFRYLGDQINIIFIFCLSEQAHKNEMIQLMWIRGSKKITSHKGQCLVAR